MTKRWDSVRSDLISTKREASKRARAEGGRGTTMTDADSYRTITTRLRGMTPKAIFVDKPPSKGKGETPIPRSLIHGADDRKIEQTFIGEEISFRLMAWKAEELGFA